MLGVYINVLEAAAEIRAIGRAGSRKPCRFQKPIQYDSKVQGRYSRLTFLGFVRIPAWTKA